MILIIVIVLTIVLIFECLRRYYDNNTVNRRTVRYISTYPQEGYVGAILQRQINSLNQLQDQVYVENINLPAQFTDPEDMILTSNLKEYADMANVPFGGSQLLNFPEYSIFTEIPFGSNSVTQLGWVRDSGLDFLNKLLSERHLYAIPLMCLPPGAGGWSNQLITQTQQLKGLKVRTFGYMAQVFKALGAQVVTRPGSQAFESLKRGELDFVEFFTLAEDSRLGAEKIAKYLYMPCWQQPSAITYLVMPISLWQSFTSKTKLAFQKISDSVLTEMMTLQMRQTAELISSLSSQYRIVEWSDPLLSSFTITYNRISNDLADSNMDFAQIRSSYTDFISRVAYSDKVSLYLPLSLVIQPTLEAGAQVFSAIIAYKLRRKDLNKINNLLGFNQFESSLELIGLSKQTVNDAISNLGYKSSIVYDELYVLNLEYVPRAIQTFLKSAQVELVKSSHLSNGQIAISSSDNVKLVEYIKSVVSFQTNIVNTPSPYYSSISMYHPTRSQLNSFLSKFDKEIDCLYISNNRIHIGIKTAYIVNLGTFDLCLNIDLDILKSVTTLSWINILAFGFRGELLFSSRDNTYDRALQMASR